MKRVLKPADEAVDSDRGFTHTVRPAAGLEPVATAAPRSVFDMRSIEEVGEAIRRRIDGDGAEVPAPLACAIFNTGELLIEVPGHPPLRLSPAHAGELIQYLRTIQEGMK